MDSLIDANELAKSLTFRKQVVYPGWRPASLLKRLGLAWAALRGDAILANFYIAEPRRTQFASLSPHFTITDNVFGPVGEDFNMEEYLVKKS